MDSSVTTRPNHYEVLGLKPTASDKEIAAAFAREIGRPRAFGGLAQVSVAFETLRNAAKRKAYDAAIGIRPESAPAVRPPSVQFRGSAHFIGAAAIGPGGLREGRLPAPDPVRPEPPIEAKAEPPFMAARAERETRDEPVVFAAQPASPPTDPRSVRFEDHAQIQWRRPLVILGALVGTAGLIGAWVGSVAGSDAQAEPSEEAVTIALPKPKQAPRIEQTAAPEWSEAEARPERHRITSAAVRPVRSAPARQPRALSEQELDELATVEVARPANAFVEQATEQAAAHAPAVQAAAPDMPLSNAMIARTIHRIGYSCGRVTSTAAAEGGGPGVFTVSCSSGHSYRASPVRGRYHFKRLRS
jgi:hypothetical protein